MLYIISLVAWGSRALYAAVALCTNHAFINIEFILCVQEVVTHFI